MMRVLVANIPLPANRFLVDLNTALREHCDVTHSSDTFWSMEGDFDVIHLHFPEYMTFELQDAYRRGLTDALIREVESRLRFWAARARLVVTRHVLLPHDALNDPMWERMYETVYSYADGVVHFGQPSVDEFRERYAGTKFFRGRAPAHVVIPHQNYASLPSDVTRSEARKHFGIPDDARVMLVFGAIRGREERDLILDTFRGLAGRTILLASRWREIPPNVSWIRLRTWIRDLKRLYYRIHPAYRFNYDFVPEENAQTYLAAADVLFIPRRRVLNSGNVALGMTFGVVVVGPDSWDVGHLLTSTGNPVFDPDRTETAVDAMERGFALAAEGTLGPANRVVAFSRWDARDCATRYFAFFTELTGNEAVTALT